MTNNTPTYLDEEGEREEQVAEYVKTLPYIPRMKVADLKNKVAPEPVFLRKIERLMSENADMAFSIPDLMVTVGGVKPVEINGELRVPKEGAASTIYERVRLALGELKRTKKITFIRRGRPSWYYWNTTGEEEEEQQREQQQTAAAAEEGSIQP